MNQSANSQLGAEIISIGDEMTSGARLDTNSQWLTQQLSLLGIPTFFHTTVGDDLSRKQSVFEIAAKRAEVVIITGGLGPTADDLTREVLSELAGVPLVLHQPSLDHIQSRFEKFGREMPRNNVIQARFPEGSEVIPNLEGTAPGIDMKIKLNEHETHIFALPGVPAEMTQMFTAYVQPALETQFKSGMVIRHRTIHCFGQGESATEELIPDLIRRDREPRVGITASKATISLRIVSTEPTEQQCFERIDETESIIREKLGKYVFGVDGQQLQDVVVEFFRQKQMKLAIFDCALHGLLAREIRVADQADDCFVGAAQFANTNQGLQWIDATEEQRQNAPLSFAEYARFQIGEPFDQCVGVGIASAIDCDEIEGRKVIPVAISIGKTNIEKKIPLIGHPSIHEERTMKQILNDLRF